MPLRPTTWLATSLVALGVAVGLAAPPAAAQDLPRGQVLDAVATRDDPSQTYAVYLPTAYTPDRPRPILIGFHPAARGRAIVDTYREAAETYGFIVVGSNVARNGPWEASLRAATALFTDVGARLVADGRRIYLTGHSGGARLALQLAIANPQIAGVIASSAGYPDVQPRKAVRFPLFATTGTDDFNHLEMRRLARALETPHRLAIFEGGHTLPPPAVATEAIAWLEVRAMVDGLRPRDATLVQQLWDRREDAAVAAGDTPDGLRLWQGLVEDFRTLRDVKAAEARAAALRTLPEVTRALRREEDDDRAELRVLEKAEGAVGDLADPARRSGALQHLARLLADLQGDAAAADATPARARARRVLRRLAATVPDRSDAEYLALLARHVVFDRAR